MSQVNFLDEVFEDTPQMVSVNKFAKYGLPRNPFPGHEEEFYAFIYGQETAKRTFKGRLEQFTKDRRVSALVVIADNRVGKTNFVRHYYQRLTQVLSNAVTSSQGGAKFLPFYTKVYEYDFFFIYRQLVEAISSDFLLDLGDQLSRKPLREDFPETDLARALQKMGKDWRGHSFNKEKRIELLLQWLRGGYRSLNTIERDELGVQDNITNSPVGSRFLRDLMDVLYERNILDGLILFFDEFERLVGAGISRSQKDRYLNDIRNFISDFQRGVFFCFAITPGALQELQNIYPAIPPRLGSQLTLETITTEAEAQEFAQRYIDWFRKETEAPRQNQKPLDLLTNDSISNVFLRASKRYGHGVPQGHLLAGLREEAERVAERGS